MSFSFLLPNTFSISKGGSVQYLTRDEVYILRLAHDFLLEQFSAGGSNFGLKPALARRELGDEVVQLAKMWLGSIRGDAVKESGKDVLNGHCGGGDFID